MESKQMQAVYSDEEVQASIGKHDDVLTALFNINPLHYAALTDHWMELCDQDLAPVIYGFEVGNYFLNCEQVDLSKGNTPISQEWVELGDDKRKKLIESVESAAKCYIGYFRKKGNLENDVIGDASKRILLNTKQIEHAFGVFMTFLKESDLMSGWLISVCVTAIVSTYYTFWTTHMEPKRLAYLRAVTKQAYQELAQASLVPINYQQIVAESRSELIKKIKELNVRNQ